MRLSLMANSTLGGIGWDGDYARELIAQGVRFINFGAHDLLIAGAREYLGKARGEK